MTAHRVDENIVLVVNDVLENGRQPLRVLLSVESYRLLVARDGLAPRHIGATASTSLRALVCGLDLPVDCDKDMADDNAFVTYAYVAPGIA